MKRQKLQRAEAAVDNFIAKRLRQNKPFQSLIQTEQYDAFYKALKGTIGAQLKAVVDNPPPAGTINAQGALDKWLEVQIPDLSEHISHEKVFDYLKFCFEWGVKAQYKRFGLKVKADMPELQKVETYGFEVTNPDYIAALEDDANYLLNLSTIDDTTRAEIIRRFQQGTLDGMTPQEAADNLADNIDEMTDMRATMIARTETAQAMGSGNLAAMVENGVQTKHWVTAGGKPCEICQGNEAQGSIPVNESFESGDDSEPAHPNCECYTEGDEIDLDSIDIWDGS